MMSCYRIFLFYVYKFYCIFFKIENDFNVKYPDAKIFSNEDRGKLQICLERFVLSKNIPLGYCALLLDKLVLCPAGEINYQTYVGAH